MGGIACSGLFRGAPVPTVNPREAAERAARELLRHLADCEGPCAVRVTDAEGRWACLIQAWDTSRPMPVASAERRLRKGGRVECKRDVVEVVRAANRPLTRKQVLKALKAAGKEHGAGTVAKALADLTSAGELVNPLDKRGYRLPQWDREHPNLFS